MSPDDETFIESREHYRILSFYQQSTLLSCIRECEVNLVQRCAFTQVPIPYQRNETKLTIMNVKRVKIILVTMIVRDTKH